mmetsp:Transcript_431/g.845  ORF Transcript_431/g.845 Transcript_431/m.845 type:complete len:224 (-) Transcript_431:98-769(-)
MLPLLLEVIRRLEAASIGTGERLMVFSGHDTVLAPLLAAMGAMGRSPELCRWPPYASRLVVELWREQEQRGGQGAEGHDQQPHARAIGNGGQGDSTRAQGPETHSEQGAGVQRPEGQASGHLRVLFNGQPITHLLAGCDQQHESNRPNNKRRQLHQKGGMLREISHGHQAELLPESHARPHPHALYGDAHAEPPPRSELCPLPEFARTVRAMAKTFAAVCGKQ